MTTSMQPSPTLQGNITLDSLRELYEVQEAHLRALIIGDKGVGKTKLLSTARRPVLGYFFDPDGELTLFEDDPETKKSRCPKWLIPMTSYTKVNVSTAPDGRNGQEAIRLFANDIMAHKKSGIFNQIGTVVLDSLTTFGDALIGSVLTKARLNPKHGPTMEIQDWGTFLNECSFWIKTLLTLPCDVLILGHIQSDKDDVTGRIIHNVMLPGSGAQKAPILLSEVYYMFAEQVLGQANVPAKRVLLTGNDSYYKASTRLGRDGKFLLREEPDLMNLRRKAGLSTEHLPY